MIKRTQLKRSVYTVLGKAEKTEESDDNAEDNVSTDPILNLNYVDIILFDLTRAYAPITHTENFMGCLH